MRDLSFDTVVFPDGRSVPVTPEQAWSLNNGHLVEVRGTQAHVRPGQERGAALTLQRLQRGVTCDFCSDLQRSDDDVWTYPARSFTRGGAGSAGAWAACSTCHRLIEAGDRRGLARHAVQMFMAKDGVKLPRDQRRQIMRKVEKLHNDFWAHRTGPPVLNGS